MDLTGLRGGLAEAGDFLEAGGHDMKEGARILETAGQLMKEAGEMIMVGGALIMRAGEDIARGARHAYESNRPVGQGWFMIANAGVTLNTFAKLRIVGHTELFSAGQLIEKGGHLIVQGGDHFIEAGNQISAGGMLMHEDAQTNGTSTPDEKTIAFKKLASSGVNMTLAGQRLKAGGESITKVMRLLNHYGPVVVRKGTLQQRGQDIVLRGRPSGRTRQIGQGIVRWGGRLWHRVHPHRLGINPPSISRQLPEGPQPLKPGEEKYDWIDAGLNDANNLDEYEIVGDLGTGSFGSVHLAQRKDNRNIKVAIKKINIPTMLEREMAFTVQREKKAGRDLKHHNIVCMLSTFNIEDFAYLIYEFCDNGNILTHIKRDNGFTEEVTRFYSAELVMALKYMRQVGWVHRDIKPENILLDFRFHLKLTDFGLSKHKEDISGCCISAQGTKHLHKIATFCGTLVFMAPEVAMSSYFPTAPYSDLYALGCNIVNMITNHLPIRNGHRPQVQIKDDILSGNFRKLEVGRYGVKSADLVDLQLRLMKLKPDDRIGYGGYEEIIDHPFYAPLKYFMQYDTLYTRDAPPFKTPPPSNNPNQRYSAAVQLPGVQLDARGQSIAGIPDPAQPSGARAHWSDPDPRATPGGGLGPRHRNLSTTVKLHDTVDDTAGIPPPLDRPVAVSAIYDQPLTRRPRTRTDLTSVETVTFMAALQDESPRVRSSSDLLCPPIRVRDRVGTDPGALDQSVIDMHDSLPLDRLRGETLRQLIERNQLKPIPEDEDASMVFNFGTPIRDEDGLDDDVFTPQPQDMTTSTVDRSHFILEDPGAVISPDIPEDTPRRSSSRPIFTIGGRPINYSSTGSESSAPSPTTPAAPVYCDVRPQGREDDYRKIGRFYLRRRARGSRPSFEDYPPGNAVDVGRHTQGDELRPQPTTAIPWDHDRNKTVTPPIPPQVEDNNDEYDPSQVLWI